MKILIRIKLLIAILMLSAVTMRADEVKKDTFWTQFRGPGGQGIAIYAQPPVNWSETTNIIWKVAVPGMGRSSPVLLGDKIWLTTSTPRNVEKRRIGYDDMQLASNVTIGAACFSKADGKCLWNVTIYNIDNPAPVHQLNSWSTPTPFVEKGRLYCDYGTFGTACLEADTGKVIWKQQIPLDHQVGPGSSPIIYENLMILVRDGRDAQFVIALDKNTGQTVWKTNRPPIDTKSPNAKKSFVTPIIVKASGKTQMIVAGAHWVVSYDPATGNEIWRVKHGTGFSISSIAIFNKDIVYIDTGCMTAELLAIRTDGQGDVTNTNVIWRIKGQLPVMSSPLLVDNFIYCVADNGTASCIDSQNGNIIWRKQITGTYAASPVYAAGKLYFFNQKGKATVLKPGKEFETIAENRLEIEGDLVATPALVDRSIYVRTDTSLYRIEDR